MHSRLIRTSVAADDSGKSSESWPVLYDYADGNCNVIFCDQKMGVSEIVFRSPGQIFSQDILHIWTNRDLTRSTGAAASNRHHSGFQIDVFLHQVEHFSNKRPSCIEDEYEGTEGLLLDSSDRLLILYGRFQKRPDFGSRKDIGSERLTHWCFRRWH